MKMFSIIDLINAAGVENVKVQFLAQSAVKAKQCRHDTEITFATDQLSTDDMLPGVHPRNVGIVVWIPQERFQAAQRASQNTER